MCRRVTCSSCGKPTFAGCGAHIEQVLGDVPADARCRCRETSERSGSKGADDKKSQGASPSWIRKLLGT